MTAPFKEETHAEKTLQELATKQDLTAGAEKISSEIGQARLCLVKWQTGIGLALGSLLLAGFGGLAYMMAKGFCLAGF